MDVPRSESVDIRDITMKTQRFFFRKKNSPCLCRKGEDLPFPGAGGHIFRGLLQKKKNTREKRWTRDFKFYNDNH